MASDSFERFANACAPGESLRHKSVRGAFFMGTVGGMDVLVRLGGTIVLARILSPEDFGLVAMVTALTGLVDLFKDLGLGTATIQRKSITHREISSLFWINVLFGGLLAILFCACAPAISSFYGDSRLLAVTPALATTLLLGGVAVQHEALLSRQMRQGPIALIRLVASLMSTGLGIVLAFSGVGYWSLAIREIARSLACTLGLWWTCRWVPTLVLRLREVRHYLSFGRDLTFTHIVSAIIARIDGVVVGKFFGATALGAYRQAHTLVMTPVEQFNMPMFSVAQPGLSALQSDHQRYRRYYQRVVGCVAMVTMPIGVFVALYPEELTLLVLGERWLLAAPFLGVFAVAAALRPAIATTAIVLVTCGRPKVLLGLTLAHSLVLGVLMIAGLRWGALGVATAHLAASVVLIAPKLYYSFKGSPVSVGAFLSAVWIAATASACMSATLLSFRLAFPIEGLGLSLLAGFGIGATAYILPWLLLQSGRDELRLILHDVNSSLLRRRAQTFTGSGKAPYQAQGTT